MKMKSNGFWNIYLDILSVFIASLIFIGCGGSQSKDDPENDAGIVVVTDGGHGISDAGPVDIDAGLIISDGGSQCTQADQYCNADDRNGMRCKKNGTWVKWICNEGTTCSRADNGYLSCVPVGEEDGGIAGDAGLDDDGGNPLDNNTMSDRSGNIYKTVKIGDDTWMAENMADQNGVTCNVDETIPNFRDIYGCLYNWNDAKKVCPTGWHLPTFYEFPTLVDHVIDESDAQSCQDIAEALIKKDTAWSNHPNPGKDTFGFAAISPPPENDFASFWTNVGASAERAYRTYISLEYTNDLGLKYCYVSTPTYMMSYCEKNAHLSVRCVKDYSCGAHGTWDAFVGCRCEEGWAGSRCDQCADGYYGPNCRQCQPCDDNARCEDGLSGSGNCKCTTGWSGTDCKNWTGKYMQDAHGQKYRIVTIGQQTWMAENMAFTSDTVECHTNPDVENFKKIYGCLYDLTAAKAVCPDQWHLPTEEEFSTLLRHAGYLDMDESPSPTRRAFFNLIAKNSAWQYHQNGLDSFGFGALAAGWTSPKFTGFRNFGEYAHFWTDSITQASTFIYAQLRDYKEASCYQYSELDCEGRLAASTNDTSYAEGTWLSVRCIKDADATE